MERTLGPMVTLTASARSLTPCSMAARAPTPKATSFAAYPRAHSRCGSPPQPLRASCFRSAEEDLEMADAAARYMVAFVRVCAAARVRIRVARASGGRVLEEQGVWIPEPSAPPRDPHGGVVGLWETSVLFD